MKNLILFICLFNMGCAHRALVLTTDFGTKDGAVSAMKGVAFSVEPRLVVSDLTHDVTPFHIWEAAFRLEQTVPYWKSGTVFVTVVDPGVGSERQPIAALKKDGTILIGPNNGHLTLLEDQEKFIEVRRIDESRHRLKGSSESYTFHGRDLFVFLGARLASGQVDFSEVGPIIKGPLIRLNYIKARSTDREVQGTIVVLDPNYGNVWTDIPKAMIAKWGSTSKLKVEIKQGNKKVYSGVLPLGNTFADVKKGQPLAYYNSLMNLALALNQDNFALKYKIGFGPDWSITVRPSAERD